MHFVYMVRCADGTLYTGYARDPRRREQVHNSGRGAHYTACRRPVHLVQRALGLPESAAPTTARSAAGTPSTESGMAYAARFERHGASPAAAYTIIQMVPAIEVRGLCPAVHAPSLVLHPRDDVLVPPGQQPLPGTAHPVRHRFP